jgi:hypothetical protein
MLTNSYFNPDNSMVAQRLIRPDRDPRAFLDAINLFEKVCRKVAFEKAWNWIRGRRTECLMDLDDIKTVVKVTNSHYCGLREIPLSQIHGTQGRMCDFDSQFQPLSARTRERWLNVAAAWYQGLALPPVELVKIGSYYFVRDGNHRVSVARAMGKFEIDAEVIELQVAGHLPWEQAAYGIVNQAPSVV